MSFEGEKDVVRAGRRTVVVENQSARVCSLKGFVSRMLVQKQIFDQPRIARNRSPRRARYINILPKLQFLRPNWQRNSHNKFKPFYMITLNIFATKYASAWPPPYYLSLYPFITHPPSHKQSWHTQSSPFQSINPYLIPMFAAKTVVATLLLVLASSISITVSSVKERCMIVTSNNAQHFLKVDLKFDGFEGQTKQEGYRVVLLNTETLEEQAFQVYQGTFRKEFQLTQNVVYRLCFKIVHSRSSSAQIRKIMQYNAGTTHKQGLNDLKINIPQSLLKVSDLQDTYTYLIRSQKLFETAKEYSAKMKNMEDESFDQQKQRIETLKVVSLVELVVICLFGAYQYVKLRHLIEDKQQG